MFWARLGVIRHPDKTGICLFIAHGLTTLSFVRLVAPFFSGRFVSYYFWTQSAAAVSRRLTLEDTEAIVYFSVYFVLTQFALLGLVYAFARGG